MKNNVFHITILGEPFTLTMQELRWILTREAFDMYFKVRFQKGNINFGRGSLCTAEFLEELN